MRLCGKAIGIFFCILPMVLSCAAAGELMLPLAAAVCLHEAAHLLALHAVGGRLRDFRAAPFGLRLEMDENTLSAGGEALVAAAGSAANLLCALLAWGLHAAFRLDLAAFGLLNLFCALSICCRRYRWTAADCSVSCSARCGIPFARCG